MIRLDFLDFETELDYDYIFVSYIDLRYVSDSIILSLNEVLYLSNETWTFLSL